MDVFTIKCSRGDCVIEFSDRQPEDRSQHIENYKVTITRHDLFCAAQVYGGYSHSSPARWFLDLAKAWQGWQGEKQWDSLEHEFSLHATRDRLGHIVIRTELQSGLYDDSWLVRATIFVDAGQLEGIAKHAALFFGQEGRLI